jgi:hypothetical protein
VTSEAFATGGWDAASDALAGLMSDKRPEITWTYVVLANDRSVLELWRAFRDVGNALAGNPAACHSYFIGRGNAPSDLESVKSSVARRAAAYLSGKANLIKGTTPTIPSAQTARPLFDRAMAAGAPFSDAEWNIVENPATELPNAPDVVACAAQIKFFDKILSLPDHDAAQLIRYEWARPLAMQLSAKNHSS